MINDKQRLDFSEIINKTLILKPDREGIGTLGEKSFHLILKRFFEPDSAYHEKKAGRYVADILKGIEITEIQTRAFSSMRKKILYYQKDYNLNIVYPIAVNKYISWINVETGEITKKRKSTKKGTPADFLSELYSLRPIFPLVNVKFTLVLCSVEDYRLLNGWSFDKKKGSSRYERIPTELIDIITLEKAEDFEKIFPSSLGECFTVNEFAKAAKMTPRRAAVSVQTLSSLGVCERIGVNGRAYIYKRRYCNILI